MGLEDWPNTRLPGDRPRSGSWRRSAGILGPQVNALRSPPDRAGHGPARTRSTSSRYVGVPVAPFPRWMVCPCCRRLAPLSSDQFELKPDPYRPDRVRYVHENCRIPASCPPSSPPASSWPARTATWTTSLGQVRPRRRRRTTRYKLQLLEIGAVGRGGGHLRPVRDLRHVPPDVRRLQAARQRPARLPGQAAPPAGLRRRRVQGRAGPADPGRAMLQGASNTWFPSCSRRCRSRKARTCSSSLWTKLERPLRGRGRGGHRQAAASATSCGTSPSTPTPNSGRRSRRSRRRARRRPASDVDDLKTPEWQVFTDPAHAQKTRDFQLREVRAPRRLRRVLREDRPGRSGCGRCGRWSASPGSSRPATTRTRPSSPKPSG